MHIYDNEIAARTLAKIIFDIQSNIIIAIKAKTFWGSGDRWYYNFFLLEFAFIILFTDESHLSVWNWNYDTHKVLFENF